MKLSKTLVALIVSAAVSGCSQNMSAQSTGIKLVEQVDVQPTELAIAYKKYELENGLTLIIHEDNSDPLVHVDVTYHVGSAREELGKSGYAHLFEHMMFQGSKNVADEEHFKVVTESGGELNGTTNNDRTNYYQTVPSNQLEKMLWLEADRMGFFAQGITQEKFEIQREAVKNERGKDVDNVPYGRLMETIGQTLYDYGHPYSWSVIGYMSDLNRASAQDLKAFFKKWYGPNNATLTIGGDVKAEQVLPLVKKYFGSIPKGDHIEPAQKQPANLASSRYVSLQDNVQFPLLAKAYPTVYDGHRDQVALDALAYFIGEGQSSVLYKSLVNSQRALQVQTAHNCRELACEMLYLALPHPVSGKTLKDMEAIFDAEVAHFIEKELDESDIQFYQAKTEAEVVRSLQSVQGKVATLAAFETFFNDTKRLQKQLNALRGLTVNDVKRVYSQYIKDKPAAVVSIVPKGQPDAVAQEDNFKPTFFVPSKNDEMQVAEVKLPEVKDTFDRSIQPQAGKAKAIHVPDVWQTELNNGLAIMGAQSTETPTTTLSLYIPAGRLYDPAGQSGVARVTASMLNEATTQSSTEELAKQLARLGATISTNLDSEYIEFTVSAMSKNLDATLAVLAEKLLQPKFSEQDFMRVKGQYLQLIQHQENEPNYIADSTLNKLQFASGNYSKAAFSSLESLQSITLEQVKSYYANQIKPLGAKLAVVSSLDMKMLKPKLANTFSNWQGKPSLPKAKASIAQYQTNVIYVVDKPNAAQVQLRVAAPAMKPDLTGPFFKANLASFAFSDSFNGRIMQNLREDKGYTYSVWGRFRSYGDIGRYVLKAGIKTENTADAILEIQNEIAKLQKSGLTQQEIAFTRAAVNQGDALKYETPAAKVGFFATMMKHDADQSIVKTRSKIVESVSKHELDNLIKQYVDNDNMLYLVVGDKNTLVPQLEKNGFKVQLL
ncbi:M16 family metallopeptidase [Pseudoalteromonas sp. T1lg65]|uniref:M16 family metallopeptidase n=1 Tax=Pseudoalteromonas sp. T1lg65 TaxID=2077101 RepID=UPI003F7ACB15